MVDKGALVNSLVGYPTNMEFFSTPELLEIGGHPFPDGQLQAPPRRCPRLLPARGHGRKSST
ncbi:MAG: hypothetical protein WKG07_26810 [Hymenobacter sp.]